MLSLRRLITLAVPIACAAILMCSGAALGQFHGDGVSDPPVPEGPATPTGFVAHPGNDTVLLQWNPSTGAIGYKVYRSLTSGGGFQPVGTTEDEWYPDNDVDNGTTYYYKVRAYDIHNRQSPPTPEQEAEPLADYPTVVITWPPPEQVLSGEVTLQFQADDDYALDMITILADGIEVDCVWAEDTEYDWATNTSPSGSRVLQMAVCDASPGGQTGEEGYGAVNEAFSVPVRVQLDNFISDVSVEPFLFDPDEEEDRTYISAALATECGWLVTIEGANRTWAGYGSSIQLEWDGTDNQGQEVPDAFYTTRIEAGPGYEYNFAYYGPRKGIIGTVGFLGQDHHPKGENGHGDYSNPYSCQPEPPYEPLDSAWNCVTRFFDRMRWPGGYKPTMWAWNNDVDPADFTEDGPHSFEKVNLGLYVGHGVISAKYGFPSMRRHCIPLYNSGTDEYYFWCKNTDHGWGSEGKLKWLGMLTCKYFREIEGQDHCYETWYTKNVLPFNIGSESVHLICGFEFSCRVCSEFGRCWAEYMIGYKDKSPPRPVRLAWQLAASCLEPSGTLVRTVGWPECRNDHLKGYGTYTEPDAGNPTNLEKWDWEVP